MADNKEYVTSAGEEGTVNISEDVVAAIASAAVMEVDGVSCFANALGSEVRSKKGQTKGIRILIEEDKIVVDVYVLLTYGVVISDVAKEIQDAVSAAIESMTEITVSGVNVHVCGVAFEKGK